MKKIILIAFGLLTLASARADISLTFPENAVPQTIIVNSASIEEYAKARRPSDIVLTIDTLTNTQGLSSLTVKTPDKAASRVDISLGKDDRITLYTSPGDNLKVDVTSLSPLRYTASGTPLIDGITALNNAALPLEQQAQEIQSGTRPQTEMASLFEKYIKIFTDYIEKNPTTPAAVYAMLSLQPETFETYESIVNPTASQSILYPFYVQKQQSVKATLVADRRRQAMEQNQVPAPAFTLPGLDGKEISLSDFRGKWVILDFWGSWCGWCIKGFPQLKEAYEKYKPELEVIGIDCQETPERWKAGVEKYQLPWVHVYLSREKQDSLLKEYGVQGFPTKIIVNPEGKIMNITSGEDPEFYTALARLMGK